ncbi:glycoside hydrolase family 15 protein [Kribbella sp. NPDC049174]|uniref:glycoside hydrolase family 15 protein n=1 Tax=Kribbella sp. NPDC049174 TaxID=3364112 RepID=UPI0037226D6C
MTRHIEDYALIGDLRTAALVGLDGSIDWLSLPRFDSPAVYAALLGDTEHGRWSLAPVGQGHCTRRRYRPGTLVLETDWTTADGAVRVTDLMVPGSAAPTVVRIVDGLVGTVAMRTHNAPRMNYGKDTPALRRTAGGRWLATADDDELWLDSDVDLTIADGSWSGDFIVTAGERVSFTLAQTATVGPSAADALAATDAFWTDWISRSTYTGPWEEEVNQSLIILKALTYAPIGSIVAAATTSLPEQFGGSRNWDYRYSWLRDATFTLQAFVSTGFLDEAEAWRDWLVRTVIDNPADLQIMYDVDGADRLPEQTLDWLPGYADSTPVRVGNAAATQQQNDVWGEVLDVLSAARKAGVPGTADQEKLERALLDHIENHWQDTDHGLWEVRGPRRHFVHSKLLAWVGVDRALEGCGLEEIGRLTALRRTIAQEIFDRGYHSGRRAFTQSYGSPRLDAAVLLMPRYGFLSWDDPRMVATVDAIQRELTDHGLVLRYAVNDDGHNVDGIPGSEGTFLATSFWLADALHGIGRVDEAAELFERLLTLRNDVGLLSEEYDPRTGRHLGNTPQAFSHAGLITTAVTLSATGASSLSRINEWSA